MENEKENGYKKNSSDEAVRRLLRNYYKHLTALGIDTIERGTRLQHAKWMCLKAEGHEDTGKLNRWLGWIQGWLVAENIYGLTEIIDHTREEMQRI